MALTKLGTYLEQLDLRNGDNKYRKTSVVGLSSQKEIIRTKADLKGVDLASYKLMPPHTFAYVTDTSRRGDKVSLAFNFSEETFLVSPIYVVFAVKKDSGLISDYLFMFFNRPEFDRYARFHSWGSARETFDWNDLCDIEIELPDLPVQQKYADLYRAMRENQKIYERGLKDLKLVCDGYIEELRRQYPCEAIGKYLEPIDERNYDLSVKLAQGITNDKRFSTPKQVAVAERSAKVVRTGQFAYNRATTRNGEKISIAYREGEDCVVSSAYQVFQITREDKLLPKYLMMWFIRREFDRYARYMSRGSAHEFFEFDEMREVRIPIPDIKIQEAIADIFEEYDRRKKINEKLKVRLKGICPILIRGSLEEKAR